METVVWNNVPEQLKIADPEVHVWRASVCENEADIHYLTDQLSDAEKLRAKNYRLQKDRLSFITARGYLKILLSRYLEQSVSQIQFQFNQYGKPELSTSLKSQLRFNVSHSGKMVLMGFSMRGEIGVDIEKIRPLNRLNQIAIRYFSELEREELKKVPVERKNEVFFSCWAGKEAFIKTKGVGLGIPLNSFSIMLDSEKSAQLILPGEDENISWHIKKMTAHKDYASFVVVSGLKPEYFFFDATGLIKSGAE